MDKFCINHTFSEAHWYCKKCHISYCFSCVEKKDFKFSKDETFLHVCPSCKRSVEWTGIGHISENFLTALIKTVIYPFSAFPLLVITVLSFFGMLFSGNFYFNECLFAFIWTLIAAYALSILPHTMNGNKGAPGFKAIPPHELIGHVFTVFRVSMIYLAIALFCFIVLQFENTSLSMVTTTLVAFVLPFVMMRILTTSQYNASLDLGTFWKVLRKTGLLYMLTAIAYIDIITLFYQFLYLQPRIIIPVLCFTMIAIHRLLSQLILKCHKELNYSLNYEHFKKHYSLETLHGFKA
jgi:hypothetical protein